MEDLDNVYYEAWKIDWKKMQPIHLLSQWSLDACIKRQWYLPLILCCVMWVYIIYFTETFRGN